jgi:hypothetical protein
MKIKITSPCKIGDRKLLPGETIDAPTAKAEKYIGNRWAIEVAEDKPKRRIKHGNWQNDQ